MVFGPSICRGRGYLRFWTRVFKSQLLPSTWPILVEFRSASSEIRRRKKNERKKERRKKNPGKNINTPTDMSGGLIKSDWTLVRRSRKQRCYRTNDNTAVMLRAVLYGLQGFPYVWQLYISGQILRAISLACLLATVLTFILLPYVYLCVYLFHSSLISVLLVAKLGTTSEYFWLTLRNMSDTLPGHGHRCTYRARSFSLKLT